jgi:small-conductance mechanosensitive channel
MVTPWFNGGVNFNSGNTALEIAWAAGILLLSAVLAWLINYLAQYVGRRLTANKPESTLSITIEGAVRPIIVLVLAEGVILALGSISALQSWHDELLKAAIGAVIIMITYGIARTAGSLLDWQLSKTRGRAKKQLDAGVASFLKRMAQLIIYAVGLLIFLDYLGIPISPLIAGLGIGGLAVALALQPTLGNFFASIQIFSDRVARVGDYIELDGNINGYVVDIGWRSTRIRTPYNNTVIIPNSKFAESLITNYNSPNTALAVLVYCGVSYDSDLARVKDIVTEVANEINQMDEAVKNFEPWIAFDNFGESNIVFWVWMQAKDRLASFRLKSELIMRLHQRFKQEGITINYPVRMNYLKLPPDFPAALKTGKT